MLLSRPDGAGLDAAAVNLRRWTAATWMVLAVLLAAVSGSVLAHDVRSTPVFGDSATFAMQAVSLADAGRDLSYGPEDAAAYEELGWGDPVGLLFQRKGDGYAFAKPYAYSVALAAGLIVTDDDGFGFALANVVLLLAIAAVAAAILRERLRGPVVPVVVGTFVLGSHLWLYAWSLSVELLLVLVVAAFGALWVRARDGANVGLAIAAAVIMGLVGPEKPPFVLLLLPPMVLLLARQGSWARRGAVVAALLASFGLATVPYLWASDGDAWQGYSGDRFVSGATPPFAAGGDGDELVLDVDTDRFFSDDFLTSSLTDGGDRLQSFAYFFIGRHTGLLVFMPLALVIAGLAVRHVRRPDVAVLLIGLGCYVAFYLLLFPTNYWGGGVSLGNRYFLQASPLLLCLAAVAPIPARALVRGSLGAAAVGVVLMSAHVWHPSSAIMRMDRTNAIQSLLPFESNQRNVEFFRCGALGCIPRPS